jgi:hypothetical protein
MVAEVSECACGIFNFEALIPKSRDDSSPESYLYVAQSIESPRAELARGQDILN